MTAPFLISLREGLEMALIVAIILAYLGKTGNRSQYRYVWFGVFGAAVVSLIVSFRETFGLRKTQRSKYVQKHAVSKKAQNIIFCRRSLTTKYFVDKRIDAN